MKTENQIPTQVQNPKGLHQRYAIMKLEPYIVPASASDGNSMYGKRVEDIPEHISYKKVPVDAYAEYFVLRLDEGGSDPNHIKACRIGIHAYADAIQPFIPDLANDLRQRYPLLP